MDATMKATKLQIKAAESRVSALRAEETDPYTMSLGRAAVRSVRESREAAEAEWMRLMVG